MTHCPVCEKAWNEHGTACQPEPEKLAIIMRGLTHPQMHGDFYAWWHGLSDFDKNFVSTTTPQGLAMFAWTRSREVLRAQVPA